MVSHKALTHTLVWQPRLKGGERSQAPCPLLSEPSPDAQGFFPNRVKTEPVEGGCAPPVRGDDLGGPVGRWKRRGGPGMRFGTSLSCWPAVPSGVLRRGHGWGLPSHRPRRSVPLSVARRFRPAACFASHICDLCNLWNAGDLASRPARPAAG